jgi:hypothetical protein
MLRTDESENQGNPRGQPCHDEEREPCPICGLLRYAQFGKLTTFEKDIVELTVKNATATIIVTVRSDIPVSITESFSTPRKRGNRPCGY